MLKGFYLKIKCIMKKFMVILDLTGIIKLQLNKNQNTEIVEKYTQQLMLHLKKNVFSQRSCV